MTILYGFPPVAGKHARILVLGSMPGAASLEKQQYYGKPQNAFWRIMGALYAAGPELDYAARLQRLTEAGVALWDVVSACKREGSLDSAIQMDTLVTNDFVTFFSAQRRISHVFFNGRKAEEIFRRLVMPELGAVGRDISFTVLPSTSPAMATLDFAGKLERWRMLVEVCPPQLSGNMRL